MAYSYCWCCTGSVFYLGTNAANVGGNLCIHRVNNDLSSIASSEVLEITSSSVCDEIEADSDGNIYASQSAYLAKFDADLNEQWQVTALALDVNAIAVDSTNGWVYAGGHPFNTSNPQIRKYDLDGTEITTGSWPVNLGVDVASGTLVVWSLAIDSSGTLWVGHGAKNSTGSPSLTNLDTDGSIIDDFQPFDDIGGTPLNYQYPRRIIFDSSGNMYVALTPGWKQPSTKLDTIKKLDSSITELWGAQSDSSGQDGFDVHLFDGESKVALSCNASSSNDTLKVYNASTGAELWGDNYPTVRRMSSDADGNLYTAIQDTSTSSGTPKTVCVKYNSSGSMLAELDYGDWAQGLKVV